ncbi:MAG: hypothetical protein H7Z41_01370, partial [Cytophagales bacterium]|nr:hypothetical protein [Armatimonadota bacterium]
MLDSKTAGERLKQFEDKDAEKRQAERIKALPEMLRTTAFALQGRKPDGATWGGEFSGNEATKRRTEAENLAGETLDTATHDERAALFSALYPKLGAILADWWMPGSPVPYQAGYTRKAFRVAPDRRDILRTPRLSDFIHVF